MSRFGTIVWLLALLWLVSFAVSSLIGKEGIAGESIKVIPVTGAIGFAGINPLLMKYAQPDDIIEKLDKAGDDRNVKGVILEINCPGGAVVGSKEVADAVKKLKQKKPVVALIREVGTSGGYWIASAADKVIADPLSVTGSIGVAGSYLEFSGLMKKYDVAYEEISAGKYKEMGSPFRELTEEEKGLLMQKVNAIQDYFIEDVARNRGLKTDDVTKIATGEFFLGKEAKEIGLVDELGNMDTAFNVTKELAKAPDARLAREKQKRSLYDYLSEFSLRSSYLIGRGIGAELKAPVDGMLIRA
ncbi:MAG: signal peptide peptidase SppA [Nanoarchaeota archaeon]|nr:signal peptide peptidase SppA [Nanoarchaeota archaeon]